MTRSIRTMFAAVFALALSSAAPSFAGDPAVPGIRGEMTANMMDAGGKLIELAGAVPAGKWSWRPGKDVRSTGEVFLHVVQANYFFGSMLGAQPPMGREEIMALDKTPQTPEKTSQMLKDSYAFASKAFADTPDADLEATVDFFGNKLSKRALMLVVVAHAHEHLGQAIAYARSNGVVPPWTAREQAAAAKKKAAKPVQPGHEGHNH